jgi:cytochrome c oxidase assembly factor CtaG/ferredoxin
VSPTLDAFLRSWPLEPWLLAALLLAAWIYGRGWRILHRRDAGRWHAGHLGAFLGGLAAIFLALASPIEPFAFLLLQVHMLQHLLLSMVAPPLLWLGAPLFPLLRGLPAPIRTYWAAPVFRSPSVRQLFGRLTHPGTALPLFVAAFWLWHVPALYTLALRSDGWHIVQHACFLGTGLLFWYPVVRPYPSRPRWSPWLLFPYLIAADVQNTILSALLTFSSQVLYPHYAQVPRLGGLSALNDQSAAGVLMWVPSSLAFLLPLFGLGVRLMAGGGDKVTRWQGDRVTKKVSPPSRISLPLVTPSVTSVTLSPCHPATLSSFDLLRVPLLGRFLKWRHARLCLQLPLLLVAVAVVHDGLSGPAVGPMNLAGVLPWVHWRGLLILGLLVAGNVFCLACPFMLPRAIARRFLPRGRAWPRWLRGKWLAIVLLGLFLWAYEAFSLWDSPWWTAWFVLAYFVGALVVDGLFRGAAFCKYVCPIGQFNFVQSLASPLEVKSRDPAVCASCRTKDCIRGRDGIPGCELHLFVPRKAGNMDCTACLDCVHACPHDNIGLVATPPAADLWHDRHRSGVGRLGKRPDVAALVLLLVFGSFANAAGMVAPVVEWQDRLGAPRLLTITVFNLVALVALPLLAAGTAAALGRWWSQDTASVLEVGTRYAYALLPLGFAMWLSHYSFHFLSSYDTAVPVAQRFAADVGGVSLGKPEWVAACCRPVGTWLLRLEVLFLDGGLLLSLYTAYRIARSRSSPVLKALTPWAVLILLLFAVGVWIVFQPMEMRGTLPG